MTSERVATQLLNAVKGWRHWVGNDMLNQLGVPTVDGIRERDTHFIQRLLVADADAARTMLEFFELDAFAYDPVLWRERGLRLFVSHISESKAKLQPLVAELAQYNIHCFLAHEAIRPASDWRNELLKALGTMDALLSFHSKGFRESEWCAQEVGFALGRGATVIAMMDGESPAGFLGAIQAIRWRPEAASGTAAEVIACLLNNRSCATALGEALARRLKFVGSWDSAGACIDNLGRCGELSEAARRNVELALLLNDQVHGNERAMALVEDGQAEES